MYTNQREMQMFVEDILNTKLPLDGPQWRVFTQKYKHPDDGKTYLIQIWLSHHSFMDGVSSMALSAAACKNYSKDLFIKFQPVSFWQQMALRVMFPF